MALGPVVIVSLALVSPASASATPLPHEPAPSCVVMYESWRYTDAANNCVDTLSVAVVYEDGATSRCSTLVPGARTTVGEGYLGQHGRADHLALCGAS
ncbi:alpha-amylase [Streptomyces sp. NPDC059696]|uniref:alpha-amylase n=1 Tax=Streptomyces sp. NPDC059696 TaxID=3346911 RepID=UPI003698022A